MCFEPLRIAADYRLNQPVVRQFEPCGATALLSPNQMGVQQGPNDAVVQPFGLVRSLQNLAADFAACDQLVAEPFADYALPRLNTTGDTENRKVVIGS